MPLVGYSHLAVAVAPTVAAGAFKALANILLRKPAFVVPSFVDVVTVTSPGTERSTL
ncbi:hypothetical protein D3C84_1289780 [compost metagenome]